MEPKYIMYQVCLTILPSSSHFPRCFRHVDVLSRRMRECCVHGCPEYDSPWDPGPYEKLRLMQNAEKCESVFHLACMSFEEAKAPGGNQHRYGENALLGSFCCEAIMLTSTVWIGPKKHKNMSGLFLTEILQKKKEKKERNEKKRKTKKVNKTWNTIYYQLLLSWDYSDKLQDGKSRP